VPISIPNAQVYRAGGPGTTTVFAIPEASTVTGITINHLEDATHTQGQESLEVSLSSDQAGQDVLARGIITGDFDGPIGDAAAGEITFPSLTLEGGKNYYLHIQGHQGSIKTWAVALANEQWDDPIPMRVDGKDGFSIYRGLDMAPYGEDTPQKVNEMLNQLANTDYVMLTSNRLYDSIPRLPMRYPVTTRYYQALFDGTLGFERIATFTSYPSLLAWGAPDNIADKSDEERDEIGVWLGLPFPDQSAEEAFSVYDHPKVQIFRRTEAFEIEAARAMLTEGIDFNGIARIRPVEVPQYRDLMLTEQELETQQQGGTWSDLFNEDGWSNRLSVLVWLLLIEALGLAAFPLAHFLLGRLTDGGYLPAKALGVLLLGYLSWLLAATKVLPFTRGTIALVLAFLVLLGGIVAWRRWDELKTLVRTRKKLLLLEEAVFLGGFLLFLLIRMGNPDLWHPWFGGEKPMDFAYLNAIIRSTTFPPYDPWFAGGYLNYYYFGHVIDATLIKLTGIIPSVAYNLAIPLFYGLTCGGVFTVVYHLIKRKKTEPAPDDGWDRRAIAWGLVGVTFVAILGNLGEYMLVLLQLGRISESAFESSIPGLASLIRGIVGFWKAVHKGLPIGIGSWYWDASRIMTRGEINEFPFFTFLYADLHPHMIALPYTLLLLTQIVALVKNQALARDKGSVFSIWAILPPSGVLLGMALILGALRCAHFWDFPTYLLLAISGWAIALYERRRRFGLHIIGGIVLLALLLLMLSPLLYQPFWNRYGSFYSSVQPWTGERALVGEYIVIHGLFLYILVTYLCVKAFGRGTQEAPLRLVGMALRYWDRLPELARRLSRWVRQRRVLYATLSIGLILLLVAAFFFLPAKDPTGEPSKLPGAELIRTMRGNSLLGWLTLIASFGLVLLFRRKENGTGRLIALLILAGLGLTGGVEVLVVKGDIGRMNTVFRFYFQTWILWGIASAFALSRLWKRQERWRSGARKRWQALLYVLVALCALYPLLATPAKIKDRFPDTDLGPGLDGAAFMEQAVYGDPGPGDGQGGKIVLAEDAAAIRWLQENVEGSPVVMEGNGGLYRWGSRISVHTGLPTIIGWDWHQKQQRGFIGPVVENRLRDLDALYGDPDIDRTMELLRKYRVSYIVVGQMERYYYPAEGLAKFEQMEGPYLERVYGGNESSTETPPTRPPEPTVSPYPSPATSSTTYPGPTPIPEKQVPAGRADAPLGGTIIYRVLPSVWEP
jgi:YYY domain-containing protein